MARAHSNKALREKLIMTQSSFLQHYLTRIVAIALMLIAYALAREPVLSSGERANLAEPFQFSRHALPDVAPEWPAHAPQQIRDVHPKLKKIAGWISAVGAAAALGDLDGNGLPDDVCYVDTRKDMVIVGPVPGTGARYVPRGLNLSPLPYEPATMAPMGCLPGDLNEDGQLDVLVYYWGRTPVAFLRHGPGYVPREVVAGAERWFTNAATLADLDGDGHLDVVIGNYFPDGARVLDANAGGNETMQASMSHALNGGKKHLLLWQSATKGDNPSVQFADHANVSPDHINHAWTLAVGAADLDGDLLPEIYFGNDFGPDRLLHNRSTPGKLRFDLLLGKKTFTTPHSSVLGRDSFKGMGVDFADLNSDGVPDIFVSNITTEYGLMESNLLFMSTGQVELMKNNFAPYVNRSEQLGLSRSGWAWDAKLADFNNDGTFEAVQAVGFLRGNVNRWPELQELATGNDRLLADTRSWPRFEPGDDVAGYQRNPFFVRAGDGRYYDLSAEVGLDEPQVSRGIAVGDVDDDGGLDLVFANQWGTSYFYKNTSTTRGAFLNLKLLLPLEVGKPSQTSIQTGPLNKQITGRAAIGATVTVILPNGKRLVSQVDGGNGHSGKRSPVLHFGLGAINAPVRVELNWRDPDGQPNRETLTLEPGSHTVILGWKAKGGSR
jgi:hypothetical protein